MRVRWFLLLIPLALGGARPGTARAERPSGRYLYLQPMGKQIPDADVALVKQALESFYAIEVRLLSRMELPAAAYYAPRRRHRAEKLLWFLERRLPADGERILGLTGDDISTTKGKIYDWGILGLGMLPGRTCIISTFRCRKGARDALHARVRLAKVAVHEVGHTVGLPHCPTRGCLMEDAVGKVKTTDREYDICPRCRAALKRAGKPLPERPQIPWPRP